MKIAHVTTVDMSLRYLLMAQLESASEVGEAIGISAPGGFVPELEAKEIRHRALPTSTRDVAPLADLKAGFDLWKILKEERPDVLHTHNPKPGLYGRIIGRLAGVPIVVNTVHGLYATPESSWGLRGLAYALEWLASRFSDAELVQNPEDVDLLQRKRITPREKLKLLGNGVDLSRFDPERAAAARMEARQEIGISEKDVVVGMVGRLVEEKGVIELISAAKRLESRYRVVIVGPEDEAKGDAIDKAAISDAEGSGIMFLGMRRDVERLYGAFDIFVLPSHREGFPRAAMEAAACGLPLVATDIRGCRQVVDHEVNGILVRVGDVDGLVHAIERIGSDRGLREKMARASIEKSRAEFDERRVVEKVMATYREVAIRKGLTWKFAGAFPDGTVTTIRRAEHDDVPTLATLHNELINSGFLSSLGARFLETLYGALVDAPMACVLVAESDRAIVGYISGVADTSSFYRWFVPRFAWQSIRTLFPKALAPTSIAKIWETLHYGHGDGPVTAELLAMAVAPSAQGRGIGSKLIAGLFDWSATIGIDAMKVIVGSENEAAQHLYRRNGFVEERDVVVHEGQVSRELVWRR